MRDVRSETGRPRFRPLRKMRVVFLGFKHAVLYDFSVTYKVVLSIPLMAACFYVRQWLDFALVFLATGAMLAAEMFNTVVEELCDFVESREDPRIGVIKDVAAAAAGVMILAWAVVLVIEMSRLWSSHLFR